LFDTARAYQLSEKYLGEVLSGYKREDFFVITKITNEAQRKHEVNECFEKSLKELGMNYVDLLLLHWPQTGTYIDSWRELERIYNSGRARSIGVCNCHVHHLEDLMENCSVVPMANEIECHPLLQQSEVREYCNNHNIKLIAHTPTGRMDKRIVDGLNPIADKYGTSVSQVIMRWHYQLGDVSIPNTININHLKSNMDINWGRLTDEDMKEIGKLDLGYRFWPNPDDCDFNRL
jgi:diketogulonate reductase-like aldo/keto reductase